MTPRVAGVLVNGLLLVAAVVTIAPLVWMVSVSFMAPGEASAFPPPLVPGQPTLLNYRELFAHAGMGRYLVNSVVLTVAVIKVGLVIHRFMEIGRGSHGWEWFFLVWLLGVGGMLVVTSAVA